MAEEGNADSNILEVLRLNANELQPLNWWLKRLVILDLSDSPQPLNKTIRPAISDWSLFDNRIVKLRKLGKP